MLWLKRILGTFAGRIIGVCVLLLALGMAVGSIVGAFRGEVPEAAYHSTYVCSETGRAFEHEPVDGEMEPVLSPYSHKETGYRAELCYWNADGSVRAVPTAVLLNDRLGNHEPTFCPDCGRLVVGHNPMPREGGKAPPTEVEYRASRGR